MTLARERQARILWVSRISFNFPFHAFEAGRAQVTGWGSVKYAFEARFSKPPYLVISRIGWWEIHVPIIEVTIYLPVPVFLQSVETDGFTIFKPLPGTWWVNYIAVGEGGWWGG